MGRIGFKPLNKVILIKTVILAAYFGCCISVVDVEK